MKGCRWLKPVLVGQFEFLEDARQLWPGVRHRRLHRWLEDEWTGDNHLRHSKSIALREDKSARDVKRE